MFSVKKVEDELNKKNWSQYKLAKQCNMADSTLSDLLSKENSNPSVETLLKIAEALERPIDYFFERSIGSSLYGINEELAKDFSKRNQNEVRKFSGERVGISLRKKHWSVYKLSKVAKITQGTIDSIIKQRKENPRVNTLFQISEALEVPLEFFFITVICNDIDNKDNDKKNKIDNDEDEQLSTINILKNALNKMNEKEQEKALNVLKAVFGEKYF